MLFRGVEALLAQYADEGELISFLSDFVEMIYGLPENLYASKEESPKDAEDAEQHLLYDVQKVIGTDLAPTDAALIAWLAIRLRKSRQPEAKLLDSIIERRIYKRLWIVSYDMDHDYWNEIVKLWDELDRKKRHLASLGFEGAIHKQFTGKAKTITSMKADSAKAIIEKRITLQEPWLLIDFPGARTGSDVGLHYVLEAHGRRMRKDDRIVGDLEISDVWIRYAKNLRRSAGKIRVFADPVLVDSLYASIDVELVMQELKSVLERLCT